MPKQIVGNVHWIENGRQTSRVVDVKEAFSDPAQAVAQIEYAEHSGDSRQLRLARLAYRQFQGKRYRAENTPKKYLKPKSKRKPSVGKTAAKKSLKRKTKPK
ncbi:MAG: hypothetical protein ABSG17_06465 [Spirochaetia bacterium]|jgi:hypothetical protein